MKRLDDFISELRKFLNHLFLSYDKVWRSRRRKLDSKHMFSAILAQVLNKDVSNSRLICHHLDFLTEGKFNKFSASSFSKARHRFPFEAFVDLCQWLYSYHQIPQTQRWFGYSVFAVDSMKFEVPKELEKSGFDSMNDCDSYYPQAMLTAMYDLQLGMVYDSILTQHGDERANAIQLFSGLPESSLVLGDSGFPSFNFLYEAEKSGIKLLLRIRESSASEELKEFIESDSDDEILLITPSLPSERKALRHGHVPCPIEVRVVKYVVKGQLFIVITTMTDEELSKKDIMQLYWTRWDIEEHFKLSKVGLKLRDFKAKHIDGVLQEVWASQAISILCRCLSICLKTRRDKAPDRIDHSLLGVVKIMRSTLLSWIFCKSSKVLSLTEKIEAALIKTLVKYRPGRHYKRWARGRLMAWSLKAEGVSC